MGKHRKQWETLDFIFLASKISGDGDCSHETKRRLLLDDQSRQHTKKQRHYLADKGLSSQSYGFSNSRVWMCELDYKASWAPRNWCFWTVVLEKTLLRVPWTTRRSNQSILKDISPKQSLKGLMLKLSWNSNTLATWFEELTHLKRPWCWERLKTGGEGDDRGWDVWMARPTQWIWVWVNSRSWWWTGKPGVLQSMGLQRVGHDWVIELNRYYNRASFKEESGQPRGSARANAYEPQRKPWTW